jgi:hypothetical protein
LAHYRKIDSRIWNDEKFTGLSERAQLCFFFSLTHPNTTMLGTLRGTITGLASELFAKHKKSSAGVLEGFGEALLEAYTEGFRELIGKGLVRYDDRACLLWFPNFLKYNPPESPNVIRAWPRVYDLIPECELKHTVYGRIEAYVKDLTEGFRKAFAEGFGKPLSKSMPNQEQQQEQEYKDRSTASQYSFPAQTDPADKVVAQLPTSNGKPFLVVASYFEELQSTYPDLNMKNQFQKMGVWLEAQPRRKKKQTGMKQFIVGWLNREKPSGKPNEKKKDFAGNRKQNPDGSYKL